jgi:Lipoxygenase
MDVFSKVVFGGIRKAAGAFKRTRTEDIPRPAHDPQPNVPVERITYVGDGLEVPASDDHVPMRSRAARTMMKLNNRYAPFVDRREQWESVEACRTYLSRTFGRLLPQPAVTWDKPTSDDALQRWAFQGFASHRLCRGKLMPNVKPDEMDDYVLPLEFMRAYGVRPGLARYGGDAWFSPEGKLRRIHANGRDLRPGDGAEWEAAKFNVRSASLVWATLADHVGRCHYGVANAVVLATQRYLPRDHGLRRFLAPFHFRTAAINNGAAQSLVPWGGLLHRASGFDWEGMLRIYQDAPKEYRFETVPDELRRKGVHPDTTGDLYPYGSDALAYWNRVEHFVQHAFDTSPALGEVLGARRVDTERWWGEVRRLVNGGLPDLNAKSLNDFLSHAIFTVTGFHNHVGTVTDFVTDPTFTAGKVWPGATMADRQTTVHLCIVACITGLPMPALVGDFRHLMPDDAARTSVSTFLASLRELEEDIAARNGKRSQPLLSFLPQRMAISVAI